MRCIQRYIKFVIVDDVTNSMLIYSARPIYFASADVHYIYIIHMIYSL